jgi:hypothetical protein
MPHSPYQTIVHPPIADLSEYRHSIRRLRADIDDERIDKYAVHEALEDGEHLLAQCDFLDKKLDIKVRFGCPFTFALHIHDGWAAFFCQNFGFSHVEFPSTSSPRNSFLVIIRHKDS